MVSSTHFEGVWLDRRCWSRSFFFFFFLNFKRCQPVSYAGRAHYVMVSTVHWKPFCLASQLYQPNDWLGCNFVWTLTYTHRPISLMLASQITNLSSSARSRIWVLQLDHEFELFSWIMHLSSSSAPGTIPADRSSSVRVKGQQTRHVWRGKLAQQTDVVFFFSFLTISAFHKWPFFLRQDPSWSYFSHLWS